jgi:DNA polymerase-3 subunit delta'
LGVANKQGLIRVEDAAEVLKSLALKSFEGGYKIMIVWMADKMNVEASNKLLKIIEEPPEKTVFILITENEQDLIGTIRSRCQILNFGRLHENAIADALAPLGVTITRLPLSPAAIVALIDTARADIRQNETR